MTDLAQLVMGGDRRALARAITLVESTRPEHRDEAEALLDALLAHAGGALRIGISGAPGVGKSTLIEALGTQVVAEGHRVAVLAVDPSSTRRGGSILGDKTRMEQLVRAPEAFVRPSPAGVAAGGVARRTREAIVLCEAAGFDVVLVETLGVGQSEVKVEGMVDLFVVLVAPGGGDELQGIKRGVTELADIIVVNKADGDLAAMAATTASEYAGALRLLQPKSARWTPVVLTCSSRLGTGIDQLWTTVGEFQAAIADELGSRRAVQARQWLWGEIGDTLLERIRSDTATASLAAQLEADVVAGRTSGGRAAHRVVSAIFETAADVTI
jgi:LAO/AO transport system kinase